MLPAIEKVPGSTGSNMVYAQWQGYLKKNNAYARRFKDFIRKYDMCLEHVHTSGHATVDKLKEFAEALNPGRIIPIHTEHAERFKEFFGPVTILKDGEVFDLMAGSSH